MQWGAKDYTQNRRINCRFCRQILTALILNEQEQMEPIFPDYSDSQPPTASEACEAVVTVPNSAPASPPTPQSSGVGLWMRDLLLSAAASVLIITFLYQPVRVEGPSMLPRLENEDRLFINKFVYHLSSIKRGDVVVFHYPRNPATSYIKRVIALPGDRLWIDHGVVWINDKPLRENYVPPEYRDGRSYAEMVVPDDTYFMMGDHRSISSDSREFGPVERSLIYGKAVFVYWPARDAGVVQ
jgi:signal peptidase I